MKTVNMGGGQPPSDLKERVTQHLLETGVISGGDIAGLQGAPEPFGDGKASEEPTAFDSPADGREPIVAAADNSPTPDAAVKAGQRENAVEGAPNMLSTASDLIKSLSTRKKVVITPEDKQAFIDALIHNKRMVMTFRPLGGAMTVVVRSRTLPETYAIIGRQRAEMDTGKIVTRLDYTVRVRSMLMAAQVQEVNETAYPTLPEPLQAVMQPDGKAAEPGWVDWIDYWARQSDGLHAIVWQCVEQFEDKYWRMIEDAQNQDFWSPAASTSA